jgi:hypothetical protein
MTVNEHVETSPMTCSEVDELAGAFALGALPEDEALRVVAHLDSCTVGHPELAEFQEVAALLPLACEEVDPPAALLHRIMAEALDERPALRVVPTAAPKRSRARGWQWAGVWAAAAALILAVGIGVWNVQLHSQLNDRYQAGRSAQLHDLLAAGRIQPLAPQPNGAGIAAAVVLADNGAAYLTGRLPATPQGDVYEAWVISGTTVTPAGTFSVAADGVPVASSGANGATVQNGSVQLTAPAGPSKTVALTVEPSGGSKQPSESPRAVAKLS